MDIELPPDFSEFLKSLNAQGVEYLLVGGYAVGHYGYPRVTNDMDVWIRVDPENARRVANAVRDFGFDTPNLSPQLFLKEDQVIRMGIPPMRIEIITSISGVAFDECYADRRTITVGDVPVDVISLPHLKANKQASGRHKDLDDLDNLP